jgi:hypothetical protein
MYFLSLGLLLRDQEYLCMGTDEEPWLSCNILSSKAPSHRLHDTVGGNMIGAMPQGTLSTSVQHKRFVNGGIDRRLWPSMGEINADSTPLAESFDLLPTVTRRPLITRDPSRRGEANPHRYETLEAGSRF